MRASYQKSAERWNAKTNTNLLRSCCLCLCLAHWRSRNARPQDIGFHMNIPCGSIVAWGSCSVSYTSSWRPWTGIRRTEGKDLGWPCTSPVVFTTTWMQLRHHRTSGLRTAIVAGEREQHLLLLVIVTNSVFVSFARIFSSQGARDILQLTASLAQKWLLVNQCYIVHKGTICMWFVWNSELHVCLIKPFRFIDRKLVSSLTYHKSNVVLNTFNSFIDQ
jgi:hypothetical protein